MDVLALAIGFEEKLEAFYLEQATAHQNSGLAHVFQLLAREERKHAELLRKHASKLAGLSIENHDLLSEVKQLFDDMNHIHSSIKVNLEQLDVYRFAQQQETDSIEAYEKLLQEAAGDEEKEIFYYLIEEEKKHYSILEQIIEFVSRPEDWVEDAEFGLRKEY